MPKYRNCNTFQTVFQFVLLLCPLVQKLWTVCYVGNPHTPVCVCSQLVINILLLGRKSGRDERGATGNSLFSCAVWNYSTDFHQTRSPWDLTANTDVALQLLRPDSAAAGRRVTSRKTRCKRTSIIDSVLCMEGLTASLLSHWYKRWHLHNSNSIPWIVAS